MGSFSKFVRPAIPPRSSISERDLDILAAVLRYRFLAAAQIVRLVGGNEDVTHRRLRKLWEGGLVNRWAFPGLRRHSEFYYYVDSRSPLELLADLRGSTFSASAFAEVRGNREKDYAGATVRGEHMKLGFLQHSLMISRMLLVSSGQTTIQKAERTMRLAIAYKVSLEELDVNSHRE